MNQQNGQQKKNGSDILYKITDMMGIILLWIVIIVCVVMAIYYTVCAFEDESYVRSAKFFWGFSAYGIVFAIAFMAMTHWANTRWKKAAAYDPVQGKMKLPPAASRSLDETLTYMTGRPGLLVWDILWGCFMFSMPLGFMGDTAHYEAVVWFVLMTGGFLIIGHIFFTIYYNHRSYRDRMINVTKRYINITNEQLYAQALEQNLIEKMVYRSMQFVVSEDYILGYTNGELTFQPAAIPICTIASAEYRLENRNTKPRGTYGILTCRLNNGNTIVFCTGKGPSVEKVPRVLSYCRIPYTYNG